MLLLLCFVLVLASGDAMMASMEVTYHFSNFSGSPSMEDLLDSSPLNSGTDSNLLPSTWTVDYAEASIIDEGDSTTFIPQDRDNKTSNGGESMGDDLRMLRERFQSLWPTDWWKSHGLYNDDYLLLINSHWLGFPPPRPSSHYILAVLYTVVMVVGVSGNFLVIFMFCRCKSLRTPANILVMNLAVSDCFMLLKMPIFIYNSIYLGPALGAFGCQVYGFLGGLTGTTSIATLAAIALDRYFVVLYPLEPLKVPTRARARACVLLAWTYGAVFSSIPLFGINQYVPEGYLTSCSFDYLANDGRSRYFILIFFTAAWVVPFAFISFCYAAICRAVAVAANYSSSVTVRAVSKLSDRRDASSRRERQRRKTELRLAIVVLGVVALWFVSWTPYAVVALLGFSGKRHLVTPLASMVPALFCKMASCIDPFVYAITHPRFRKELARRFSCWEKKRHGKGMHTAGNRRGTGARGGRDMRKRANEDRRRGDAEDGSSVSEEEVVVMDARGSSIIDASEATSTSGERRNGDSRAEYSQEGPWTTEGRLYRSFPIAAKRKPFASWILGRKKVDMRDVQSPGIEIVSFQQKTPSMIDGKNLGKDLELTV
uniref:Rh7-like protein n=1 Tax=Orthetrum albistylum TaxID=254766 RepID=A0A0C6G2N4_9ODON|nr:opsin, rhodopsin-7 like [Orthetrum albistylum]